MLHISRRFSRWRAKSLASQQTKLLLCRKDAIRLGRWTELRCDSACLRSRHHDVWPDLGMLKLPPPLRYAGRPKLGLPRVLAARELPPPEA
jgi:hypothetical protein